MNLGIVGVLLKKELLDLLRDRRTLISLVVAPMVVGPVIMIAMNSYVRRSEEQAKSERYKVGIREDVRLSGLREALGQSGLEVTEEADPRAAVENKAVTFGIAVTAKGDRPQLTFFSDNSEMKNSMARSRVNEAIEKVWREQIRTELKKRDVPESVTQPFGRTSVNVAQPRKMTGAFIGRLIGFLLLIFLFNGAMYSAVDATAGEKERKTLEILLASAAGRLEIVTAKVLTAMCTSFGTTVLSIASYAVALTQGRKGGADMMAIPTDPATMALIALLILPVAVMAASISIAAATPAKSTREAMSYLTPGLFIVMFLGMVTFMVDGPPSLVFSFIPFTNFAQTLRDVISGDWTWKAYLATTAANLVYSAIAVGLAVRSFTNEKVLFRT